MIQNKDFSGNIAITKCLLLCNKNAKLNVFSKQIID